MDKKNDQREQPLVRRVSTGLLKGRARAEEKCWEWLGIPYAAPPVGELRWRKPQDPAPWEGIRPAVEFGPRSIQKSADGVIGSEDCLYLNVFRPQTEEVLPVFFFIHGGNNQTDSGELLNGPFMAQKLHAVVVSINLRLTAIGWLNLPALHTGDPLEDSGNFGLLDILKSLDWVRENIGAFGGDRDNVTVCGYSSGSRNLLCMLISPLFRGKFHKAITFSGGFTTIDPAEGGAIAARALAKLVVEDGICPDEETAAAWLLRDDPEVREYLYQVEGRRFGPLMAGAAIHMNVFPHLFADGTVIPRESFDVLERGQATQVPMMVLSGGNEFTLFANKDPLFKDADFDDPQTEAEYRFVSKYGSALFGYVNAEQNARAFSGLPGQPPLYAARFLWGMDPRVTGRMGAMRMGGTHGLDLFTMMEMQRAMYLVSDEVYTPENEPGRRELARIYQGYLRNFIRTGDPNGEELPRWEPWENLAGDWKLLMADADRTTAHVEMSTECVEEPLVLAEVVQDRTVSEERKDYLLRHVLNGRFFSKNLDLYWQAQTRS